MTHYTETRRAARRMLRQRDALDLLSLFRVARWWIGNEQRSIELLVKYEIALYPIRWCDTRVGAPNRDLNANGRNCATSCAERPELWWSSAVSIRPANCERPACARETRRPTFANGIKTVCFWTEFRMARSVRIRRPPTGGHPTITFLPFAELT